MKGHTAFLEAVKRVTDKSPEVQFRVAGKEAGVSIALLKNHASQLGIEDKVEFLGHVPSADEFIRSVSIGVSGLDIAMTPGSDAVI